MKTISKSNTLRGALLAGTIISGVMLGTVGVSLAPIQASAQDYTSGNLSGDVTDQDGVAVAGAKVVIKSPQGATYTSTTSASGQFEARALAVGVYKITISKSGYLDESSTVTIGSVSNTYSFNLQSESAAKGSVVVVKGAKKRNDFAKTEIGASVNVQDLANKIPVGRSINSVVLLTPGASIPDATINASARRNQSLASLAGTSAAESSYYINGMQVTDQRTFLGYADLPFDFIDRIETKTGGYAAEFGRGTGGVVNMVTRSGTNDFVAGASFFTSPSGLRGHSPTTYAPGGTNSAGQIIFNDNTSSQSSEASIYIGGPIIKDHLFYFLDYNPRMSKSASGSSFSTPTTTAGTQTFSKTTSPRWGGKLDFVLNPDHRLEYTIFSDEATTYYNPYVVRKSDLQLTGPSPAYNQLSGGTNQIAKYTGRFTDWFTLSALYGKAISKYQDDGPAIVQPAVYDYALGGYINSNRAGLYNLSGQDERDTYRVDADFYFELVGKHHVRVGYDREDLTTKAYSAYNGGAIYYAYDDDTIEKLTFANKGTFDAQQSAIYLQDSWQITPDFSLQLGLRNDIYDYKNINGVSYIKIDNQIAPRLGFNWDPFGKKTDKVYGFVGDYYLPIATNTSLRASSGEVYTDEIFNGSRDANGKVVLDSNNTPVLGSRISIDYYSPPGAPDPRAVTEADLKPMYEREMLLGYEHTFETGRFANWRVGARAIYRNLENTIEDTAIGDAVLRYCARKNLTNCGDSPDIYPYVLFNPGDEARVFVDLQGDAAALGDGSANPAYNPQWIDLTTDDMAMPKAKREYKALELTFERPFDGKWSAGGSYTLAKSEGNYEGAVKSDIGQTDTSITQDFDHHANTLNAYGKLPNGHRHTFKVYGNYVFNDIISIGGNYTLQTGRAYSCIGVVPLSVDPYAPQSGTPSGWFCPGDTLNTATAATNDYLNVPSPRGSRGTTDTITQLDLNAKISLYKNDRDGGVDLTVDVFNVFDNQGVTRVVEAGEIRTSASGVKGMKAAYWGNPRSYQSPRFVRLGIKYKF